MKFPNLFRQQHGFHIVKLLEAKPAPTDLTDAVALAAIQEKVTRDNRMEVAKRQLIEKKMAL